MQPGRSLVTKLTRALLLYSVLVSLVFLLGFVWLYESRLRDQRAEAAARINLLLEVALENAMLKRDIPGLRDIIERLGRQRGIVAVMILNPAGVVRFASHAHLLDKSFSLEQGALCPGCGWDRKSPLDRTEMLAAGEGHAGPVLRSVKSVANREACSQCHGPAEASPVNGLVVIDHDAADLKRNAMLGALALAGAGLVVVLGLVAGTYHALQRFVLRPVAGLEAASRALAAGDLSHRVAVEGETELAALGSTFNDMAARLDRSLQDLAAREHFVQALLDALPDGVRVIDEDFRIVLANRAYGRHVGSPDVPQAGQFCYQSSNARSEPCVATLVTCPLVVLKGRTGHIKYSARHHRPDGTLTNVEVHAARVSIDGPNGARALVIEVMRDLDAEMRISQEQRLAEIGQLATGVAHEIRNPLSSVGMLLSNAEANIRQGHADQAETALRLISHEVERCLTITDSLLKLGAPSDLAPQLISLNEVIGDSVSLLRFQAEEAKVTVTVDMDAGLRVFASDSDLRMVVINLVQNAFHAMPAGGSLTITGRRRPGQRVTLSFTDTGVGIAEEDLERIFLPFWSRRADGVNGTGLGLAICRSVMVRLGGSVTVESRPEAGATFLLSLPDPDAALENDHGPAT